MNPDTYRASFRSRFLLGFLACAGLIAYALYTQFHDGLTPCPLCIFQRIAFAALGLVFLVGGLHAPRSVSGRRVYGVLALLASLAGIAVAGNHVRLQRSEEHTSELQSLMRISYAVFCLKKKKQKHKN